MVLSAADINALEIFETQYLQLLDPTDLTWPLNEVLRQLDAQTWLYEHLINSSNVQYLPPERYQRRVMKKLFERVESSIQDPNQDELSDDLTSALTTLMARNLQPEASAVQKPSHVTYTFTNSSSRELAVVTLLEFHSLISTSGTTGLRTWEAALHFGSYLVSQGKHIIEGKRVLELGAGTGLLSILCAKWLGASHVRATDGDDGVIEALSSNIFLNGLQETGRIDARSLKWGRVLDETEEGQQNPVDVVIGADITYDSRLNPSLISTLREFFLLNPDLNIFIAAPIRNDETFSKFNLACERNNFEVSEIHFSMPSPAEQLGPFYPTQTPLRIFQITSTAPIGDPFAF
ncbi:hypothetical protein EJ08DRAFT_657212 [Tothia fuscella]|uniref:Methyltransferase n=1 Tax=Tothia fuscella TaxID=1048955 RepID=A0A9P4U2X9_9PEZI|nr:hypothetical protein EJ08DRAFT_657212 [Tothia fuscella]